MTPVANQAATQCSAHAPCTERRPCVPHLLAAQVLLQPERLLPVGVPDELRLPAGELLLGVKLLACLGIDLKHQRKVPGKCQGQEGGEARTAGWRRRRRSGQAAGETAPACPHMQAVHAGLPTSAFGSAMAKYPSLGISGAGLEERSLPLLSPALASSGLAGPSPLASARVRRRRLQRVPLTLPTRCPDSG